MRLIDADALMKTLGITDMDCDKCAWGNKSFPTCNRGSDFADACSAIEDAPTIEERKKGKWMPSDTDGFVCSVCRNGYRNQPTLMGKPMFEFCPVCGADMRGEEDE